MGACAYVVQYLDADLTWRDFGPATDWKSATHLYSELSRASRRPVRLAVRLAPAQHAGSPLPVCAWSNHGITCRDTGIVEAPDLTGQVSLWCAPHWRAVLRDMRPHAYLHAINHSTSPVEHALRTHDPRLEEEL